MSPRAAPATAASAAPVLRTTLRAETRDAVRARIVDGSLPPGANVVERDLSAALGVSRTPLREALLGLQAEGLLRLEPQRGFFVAGLTVDEARELYALIGALEALAVTRGQPTDVDVLGRINRAFRGARDQHHALRCDRAWHEALISQCGTPRTVAMLDPLRAAAARYEYRFFSGRAAIARSAHQHDAIARALARRRYAEAAALLHQNWEQGLQWVEQHFASSSPR
jgi:DNA-binding GntR family transcriptional regulator